MYHFNPFHLLKTKGVNQRESTSEKTIKKCQEFFRILILIWLKNSAIRLWMFPVFNNIFTANILGMQEKRRGFIPPPFHAKGFPYWGGWGESHHHLEICSSYPPRKFPPPPNFYPPLPLNNNFQVITQSKQHF